jgi:hypothetical protein
MTTTDNEAVLGSEIAYKLRNGSRQVTLQQLDEELRAIGYRLDRSGDCHSRNRYLTGERAGESYPAVNMTVVQISNGLSAFHVDAKRDAAFDTLQSMRATEALFAVHRGRIYEI